MEKQEKMFRELKKRFTKELVLAVLDLDKNIRIEVDTLNYIIGVLWQTLDIRSQLSNQVGKNTREFDREPQQYSTDYLYNYLWSVLQLCICCMSYPNVYALSSCSLLIYLMFYYSSTICLLQGQYVVYMCSDVIP